MLIPHTMKNTILVVLLCITYSLTQAQPIPNWQWVHTQNGTQLEINPRVAQDIAGNMYTINTFHSPSIVVGGTSYVNAGIEYGDMVFAKYDAAGNVMWSKHIGTGAYESAFAIAVDKWNNIYITGTFSGDTVQFDHVVLHEAPNVGGGDIFLAKYNSNGSLIWARSWGDSLSEAAYALDFDTAGNVYMAGTFNGRKLRLGSYTLNNTSANTYTNGYIAKLDTNGNPLWASSFGNYGSEHINDIAVDKAGNAFITGFYFYGSLPIGQPDTIFPFRRFDEIYLLKYDANGVLQWGQNAGGAGGDRAFSVSLDINGNPLIVGYVLGTVNFEGQTLSTAGNVSSGFIAKYNSNLGELMWVRRLLGFETRDIAHDAQGNIYLAGAYGSTANSFDTVPLVATTLRNTLVAKLDTNANAVWVRYASARNLAESISINSNASLIYVAGSYETQALTVAGVTYPVIGGWDVYFGRLSTLPAQPSLSLAATVIQPSCQGLNNGSIALAVSGGQAPYTYVWNSSNADSLAENLAEGVHSVTVYDATGDSAVYNTTLVAPPLPSVSITAIADSVCTGDSIVLTATVSAALPYVQTWFVNGVQSTTTSYTLHTSSEVALNITDANQCQANVADTFTVLPLPQASINVSADTLCAGDSLLLHATVAGNAPFIHTWQVDGGILASDSIFVHTPGTIVLTLTDTHQCWANDTFTVTEGNCITVGIDDILLQNSISIYPNPTKASLAIYTGTNQHVAIAIYNTMGELVLNAHTLTGASIDVSGLANGLYLAYINTTETKTYIRFVKQ